MKKKWLIVSLFAALRLEAADPGGVTIPGRLFHTPEERARLDFLRHRNAAVDPAGVAIIRVDGEVRRSVGPETHWINGNPRPGRWTGAKTLLVGEQLDPDGGQPPPLLDAGKVSPQRPPP